MRNWQPKDCIAVIVIVGAVYLLATGIDSWVGASLVGIVTAYYGIEFTPFFKIGKNKKKEEDE